MRYVLGPLTRVFLKRVYADHALMEDALRANDLEWTVFRPPKLTNMSLKRKYKLFLFPGEHHRRLFSLPYPLIKAPHLRVVGNRNRHALHRKRPSELKIPILSDVGRRV